MENGFFLVPGGQSGGSISEQGVYNVALPLDNEPTDAKERQKGSHGCLDSARACRDSFRQRGVGRAV